MNVNRFQAATRAVALLLTIALSATAFANPGRGNGNNKDTGGSGSGSEPQPTTYLEVTYPVGKTFSTESANIDVTLVFEGVKGNGHSVSWRNDRGGNGSASFMGRNNFLAAAVPLAPGSNVLSFTGVEKSGAQTSVSVVVQRTEPVSTPNRPPVISGTPASSVVAGNAYYFQPVASDPDMDPLGFSIVNRPAWASFDPLTGRLSGTPAPGDARLYAGIEIAVSDGIDVVALPRFSIEVLPPPPAQGVATLSWTPPTEREDGTALTNLAGYRIRYGTTPGQLDKTIVLNGPGLTTFVVEGLAHGTWYFGMTAVDAAGLESRLSQVVSKTIS